MMFFPAKAEIHYQPLGVVGVVTPWNYPVYLSMGPLIAAMAAGNRVMIKMSEFTPHTNKAISEALAEGFSTDEVAIVEGEVDVSVAFTSLAFDHILFTGSGQVGKHVLHAAADNLVPVTLELGGKSPCILAEDYSAHRFVKNFLLSKTLNSGQTCVAPDTVYCHRSKVQEVINELKQQYSELFPSESRARDITSVINERQWQRLEHLVKDAEDKGATTIPLADGYDAERRIMPTTLVMDTSPDMEISQEEIFGPLLPIVAFDDIDDVIKDINAQPRPLALYLFSNNTDMQRKILYFTHSGGVCLNDAAFHVGVDDLPFGGVGPSGMGSYHADEGFKTFSHAKSVLIRGRINLTPLFGPPYGRSIHRLLARFFMR
jgi:coniferyl-aldehyde dehydrogenase